MKGNFLLLESFNTLYMMNFRSASTTTLYYFLQAALQQNMEITTFKQEQQADYRAF